MARVEIDEVVQNVFGTAVASASVQVNTRGGGAAVVYVAETGSPTRANPLITDSAGRVDGWLEEGSYNLVVTSTSGSYTQPFEATRGGGRGAVFNVRDNAYGAVGDGVADDSAAVLAANVACVAAGGGTIYFPAGAYKITTTTALDFSAIKGTRASIIIAGAGGGEGTSSTIDTSTTRLLNATGTTLIKAWGQQTPSLQEIYGIQVRDLVIKNTVALGASNYVIDLDLVSGLVEIDRVYIYGANLAGNGIQFRNMAQGQSSISNTKVRGFPAGVGVRIAAEATSIVSAPFNSGNITLNGVLAMDVLTGFHLKNSATLLNGISMISCKAVNSSSSTDPDNAASVGLLVESQQNFIGAFHAERFRVGIQLGSATTRACYNVLAAPVCIYPSISAGTLGAGTRAIAIVGTSRGNIIQAARIANIITASGWDYAVTFEDTCEGNDVSFMDEPSARVNVSPKFLDSTATRTNRAVLLEATRLDQMWGQGRHDYLAGASSSDVLTMEVVGDAAARSRFRARPDALFWGDGTTISTTLSNLGTNILGLTKNLAMAVKSITYSASMTPNCQDGPFQTIVATNGTAFTINAPTNPQTGLRLLFDIKNSSGGAMGVVTWNAVFLKGAFTNPANTKRTTMEFYYDGTNWVQAAAQSPDS